ncbi:hypothetical protein ACJX0J_042277, partial [Zea mays]
PECLCWMAYNLFTEPVTVVNSHDKSTRDFSAAGFIRTNSTHESQPHIYKQTEQETRPYLSLQLFGSTEEDFPPKMDSVNKYLSSESSNPLDERSPSSSLPITHKFFPKNSVDEVVRHPHITDYGDDATMGEVSTNQAWLAPPLDLFKDSERPIENGSPPNPGYQSCYALTSCSDHSPSTSNSDGQRVNSLVQSSDLDFWRKGRFLVRTNSQLVSYKEVITWNTPELTLDPLISSMFQQTNSKHVTWSLKEKIGDRYKFRILVFMHLFMFQALPVIILSTVQRTQNLAANKYKGEGMGQENCSVLKKVQIYNNILITKATINELLIPYKVLLEKEGGDVSMAGNSKIPAMIALINHYYNTIYITLDLILLTFFKQEFCDQINMAGLRSSVRPALEPDIDLEELEVHYSSFL